MTRDELVQAIHDVAKLAAAQGMPYKAIVPEFLAAAWTLISLVPKNERRAAMTAMQAWFDSGKSHVSNRWFAMTGHKG
jgi:hypothetical protein